MEDPRTGQEGLSLPGQAAHPEPSHPEPSHPEPSHPEPSHPEPSHPEPSHPELSHPEPSHPEPSHPEPSHPEPSHQEDSPPPPEADTCPLPKMWEEKCNTDNGVPSPPVFSALPWCQYFEQQQDVCVLEDVFRVYRSGSEGPLLVLLHGGGYSALSWAVCSTAISRRVTCRVLAMDLRGHGASQVLHSDDLSTQTMSRDVANVVKACYGEAPPPIVLVGHGVGGAIAVHTASSMLLPSTVGLVAIDVVEGSAMEVLHTMQNFLKGRPKSFSSVDEAVEWTVKSGQIRNLESARVSVVGQVKRFEVTEGDQSELGLVSEVVVEGNQEVPDQNQIREKTEISEAEAGVYRWRIDLSKAEKYWDGWFRGISNLFLGCNLPKLLLLSGVNRLDRSLTIGQMQGKFMMQVLPPCGHAVHEDTPEKVADALASYLLRHKFAETRGDTKSASYPFTR